MKETSCGSYSVSFYVIVNNLVSLSFLLIFALVFSTPLQCLSIKLQHWELISMCYDGIVRVILWYFVSKNEIPN
uniref:Uncharacterized protein n=1 Tax=Solanum lycopersicum TaxID=4081 RepID=A0A3Q7G2E5_SOLLC